MNIFVTTHKKVTIYAYILRNLRLECNLRILRKHNGMFWGCGEGGGSILIRLWLNKLFVK